MSCEARHLRWVDIARTRLPVPKDNRVDPFIMSMKNELVSCPEVPDLDRTVGTAGG